jgi:hypothetical protein
VIARPLALFNPTSVAKEKRDMSFWKKQGESDANQNQAQKNPNDFKNDKDRKDYQAEHNKNKQTKHDTNQKNR